METKLKTVVGKILYAILFIIILPILMIFWAAALEPVIPIEINASPLPGLIFSVIGIILFLSGISALDFRGNGLPMSPYPPVRFVSSGIYRLIAHPIYTGACFISAGVSIYFGSGSGLFFITPILILACATFVLGYEGPALEERFPGIKYRPFISIPKDSLESPTFSNRLSFYFLFLLPWLITFFIIQYFENTYRFTFPDVFSNTFFPTYEFTGYLFFGYVYPADYLPFHSQYEIEPSPIFNRSTGSLSYWFLYIPDTSVYFIHRINIE